MKALFLLAAFIGGIGAAQADPVISDQKAAQQLLGQHALTLQWIDKGGLKNAGKAEVEKDGGDWKLTGRMDAKEGFVSLVGFVTKIEKTTFTFKGKIITRVDFIYGGKECAREVEVTFERKGTRKYWRMYPIDNPCDQVADYIDIYLR